MHANDLAGYDTAVATSSLASDNFWKYELSDMTPARIDFFYTRAKTADLFDDAKRLISWLQTALLSKHNQSFIKQGDLVALAHKVPEQAFLIDDLVDALEQMTEVRQNAVLFALESGMDIDRVTSLRWNDKLDLRSTPCVSHVLKLQAVSRHVKLPYVFWEWAGNVALPLVTLKTDVQFAFGKTWPGIVESYSRMVMHSPRSDLEQLRQALDRLVNK